MTNSHHTGVGLEILFLAVFSVVHFIILGIIDGGISFRRAVKDQDDGFGQDYGGLCRFCHEM